MWIGGPLPALNVLRAGGLDLAPAEPSWHAPPAPFEGGFGPPCPMALAAREGVEGGGVRNGVGGVRRP